MTDIIEFPHNHFAPSQIEKRAGDHRLAHDRAAIAASILYDLEAAELEMQGKGVEPIPMHVSRDALLRERREMLLDDDAYNKFIVAALSGELSFH